MPATIRGTYANDWNAIAIGVKQRSGWACVRCAHPHDPAAGRTLTVHHFDGDKGNNAAWNLMALCQACHLSVQARVAPEQGLMVAPSVWAMPYIAGMIAAGKTPAPPGYDLAQWMQRFASDRNGDSWPTWAPHP